MILSTMRSLTTTNLEHMETCYVNSIQEEAISMLVGKVSWNALTFDQLTAIVTTFLIIKAQEQMTIVFTK